MFPVFLQRFLMSPFSITAETMSELSAMDTPAVKREEIIAVYDDSDRRALSLTEDIRATLQHAYHFLGDMIISQVCVSNFYCCKLCLHALFVYELHPSTSYVYELYLFTSHVYKLYLSTSYVYELHLSSSYVYELHLSSS